MRWGVAQRAGEAGQCIVGPWWVMMGFSPALLCSPHPNFILMTIMINPLLSAVLMVTL